jgi:hypothetical protein
MTLGCKRIDVAWYFSASDFAGRPRGGRGTPVFASIAFLAAESSRLVTRLASSKGNSFEFFIPVPLTPTGSPRADNTVNVSPVSPGEHHHEHPVVWFTDQPLPCFFRGGVLAIGSDQGKRIIEGCNRHLKSDPVFAKVTASLWGIPLEFHIKSIYRKAWQSSIIGKDNSIVPAWEWRQADEFVYAIYGALLSGLILLWQVKGKLQGNYWGISGKVREYWESSERDQTL